MRVCFDSKHLLFWRVLKHLFCSGRCQRVIGERGTTREFDSKQLKGGKKNPKVGRNSTTDQTSSEWLETRDSFGESYFEEQGVEECFKIGLLQSYIDLTLL
jgi:hypothetical protein